MPRSRMMPNAHAFVKGISQACRAHALLPAGSRVLVAVSGGSDSVALLHALAALATRRTWKLSLHVGHVQHHLRAEASEADARFVQDLAQRLDLPFLRADLDLTGQSGNLEARARQQRYLALLRMAHSVDARHITVAHHSDDQLETMLMRLLRGCSVAGLAGMAWRRRLRAQDMQAWLIRPMLSSTQAQARAFLQDIEQAWREDASNQDTTRMRAALRSTVLPALRAIRPDAARKALGVSHQLRLASQVLTQEVLRACQFATSTEAGFILDRVQARLWPRAVLGGVLRTLLSRTGTPKDSLGDRTLQPVIRAICDTQGGERTFQFTAAAVMVRRETVKITRA